MVGAKFSMSVVTTWRSDLCLLLAMGLVYVRVIVSSRYQCVCLLLYFLKLSCKTTHILICTFFLHVFQRRLVLSRASTLSTHLLFILVHYWYCFFMLLWKIIYVAQNKMYSSWYNSVCSPNSGCLLGLCFFLSTLFWKSVWGFWSSVGREYEDCSLLGCKAMKFFRKVQAFGRKQLDPPKYWFLCTKLHVVINQSTEIFTRNVCLCHGEMPSFKRTQNSL